MLRSSDFARVSRPEKGPYRPELRSRIAVLVAVLFCVASTSGEPSPPSRPLSAFEEKKVTALLDTQLPCLGCHRVDGRGGTIGPDLSTVRERRSPEYVAAMIDEPARVVPGTIMPRTPLSPAMRDLLVRYFATRPGNAPFAQAPRSEPRPPPSDAKANYERMCSPCHGTTGRGDGPNAPNLPVRPTDHTDAERMAARSDDALYDTIASGGAVMNRSPRMPAFGASLSPAEIRALVAYLRSLCRCGPPSWSHEKPSASP